jgi:hypothetical protein
MEMERALEDGVYHIIDSFTVYKLANLSTLLLDADIHLILVESNIIFDILRGVIGLGVVPRHIWD